MALSAAIALLALGALAHSSVISDWSNPASAQYHIQTDEGNERYFRYQTISGQYRKEKRLEDGTVIGMYAWIDDDGILRQNDYISDNEGYRILKTKNVYVGRDTPIAAAIKSAKKAPASAGTLVKSKAPVRVALKVVATTPVTPPTPLVEVSPNSVGSSTLGYDYGGLASTPLPPVGSTTPANLYLPAATVPLEEVRPSTAAPWYSQEAQYEARPSNFRNGPTYPIDNRGQTYNGNNLGNGYDPQYELYNGVSVTNDGFRYYIPRAYHEEQNLGADRKSGSFGYIDPFGIRRVIYYNAGEGGFQHRKNNRYVGFDATPYDPRPY